MSLVALAAVDVAGARVVVLDQGVELALNVDVYWALLKLSFDSISGCFWTFAEVPSLT